MANIGAHAAKQMLDWVLGGAAATQPTTRVAALTFGVPTSVSALGEIQANGDDHHRDCHIRCRRVS